MRKGWVHKRIQLYVHVYSHFWYPSSRLATDHYAFAIIRFDLKSIQVDTKIFFLWPLLCKGLAECVPVWEDRECGQCTQHNRDNYPLCNGKCQQRSGYLHTSHQPPRHLGVEQAVIRSPAAHPASICFNSISLWGIRTFSSKRASNLLTHKKIDTKTCRCLLYVCNGRHEN